jgi:hypothetical protein
LRFYQMSLTNALIRIYPRLELKKEKFLEWKVKGTVVFPGDEIIYLIIADQWRRPLKRRRFFDLFAHSKQFNPLDAQKWLLISQKDILRAVRYKFLLILL